MTTLEEMTLDDIEHCHGRVDYRKIRINEEVNNAEIQSGRRRPSEDGRDGE